MRIRRFYRDESGVAMLIFAVTLIVFIGVMVFAIDANKMASGYAKLQNSADTAALSTAEWIIQGKKAQTTDPDARLNAIDWLPDDAAIKDYGTEVLMQNFGRDQSYAKIEDLASKVSVDLQDNPEGLDIVVTACSDVSVDFTFSLGQDDVKEVCVDATARISPKGLINKEIIFVFDGYTNPENSFAQSFRHAFLGYKTFAGTNTPIPESHGAYRAGIFDKYFVSRNNMQDRNLLVGFVPAGEHVNLYPYNDFFDNPIGPAIDEFDLERMLGYYPVFNDTEFLNFIRGGDILKNYKFRSAYDALRYEEDGSDRGDLFEDVMEGRLGDPAPEEIFKVTPTGPDCDNYDFRFPNYTIARDQRLANLGHACEYRLVRGYIYDLAGMKFVQPLTDDAEIARAFIEQFRSYTPADDRGICSDSCSTSRTPDRVKDMVNGADNSVKDKYLNCDLIVHSGYVGYEPSGTTRLYNGLLWAWQNLSVNANGKWAAQSKWEEGTTPLDRNNLPLPEEVTKRDKIIIAFPTRPDTKTTGIGGPMCDSYVEYDMSVFTSHHGNSAEYGTFAYSSIFDRSKRYEDLGYSKPAWNNASYNELCSAIKEEDIDIYIFNFGSGQKLGHPIYTQNVENCASSPEKYFEQRVEDFTDDLDSVFAGLVIEAMEVKLVE